MNNKIDAIIYIQGKAKSSCCKKNIQLRLGKKTIWKFCSKCKKLLL